MACGCGPSAGTGLEEFAEEAGGDVAESAALLIHAAVLSEVRHQHGEDDGGCAFDNRRREARELRDGVDHSGAEALLRLVRRDGRVSLVRLLPGVDMLIHAVLLEVLEHAGQTARVLLCAVDEFRGDGSVGLVRSAASDHRTQTVEKTHRLSSLALSSDAAAMSGAARERRA